MTEQLRKTPLHAWHVERGAKLADFGGWEMPIEYSGVVGEHTAVRTQVGCFDVSHMGKLRISGAGAADWLNTILLNDLAAIPTGKAQYSMLLNDRAGVVDDLIVYKFADDLLWMVPNAANAAKVHAALQSRLPAGIALENLHSDYGIVAVQGPSSPQLLAQLGLPVPAEYMSAVFADYAGAQLVLCRTGYTGETGFELIAPNQILLQLWQSAVAAGAEPCGLGARDTLRLEMAYPLHGHELSEDISPLEAGASWAVGWDKPDFVGADVLRAQRAAGAPRKRVALRAVERGIPRAEMAVLREGAQVGVTTSGTFSPTLKTGIALALVTPDVKIGELLSLDVRGRLLSVEVVKPPFVQPSTN